MQLSSKEIERLKKESAQRSGCWEIDWGPEPMSQGNDNREDQLSLTLVVHQESHYVLEMFLSSLDAVDKGISAFLNATQKQLTLPKTILVRDKVLMSELLPLATALDCEIKVSRLKAIPQIRRAMNRLIF
ncbi:MAG: hypothetical protein AAB965_02760 [Patescibacteria group bacterium]|mgnify:CR=1